MICLYGYIKYFYLFEIRKIINVKLKFFKEFYYRIIFLWFYRKGILIWLVFAMIFYGVRFYLRIYGYSGVDFFI